MQRKNIFKIYKMYIYINKKHEKKNRKKDKKKKDK